MHMVKVREGKTDRDLEIRILMLIANSAKVIFVSVYTWNDWFVCYEVGISNEIRLETISDN